MATTAFRNDTAALDRAARRHPALVVATTVAAALGVNLVLFLIGTALGGEFEYLDNGEPASTNAWWVAAGTAVPLTLGLTIATLIGRKWRRVIPIAQVIGALLALATAAGPFTSDFDSAASTVSLALMHVVIGIAVVLGLTAIAKSSK